MSSTRVRAGVSAPSAHADSRPLRRPATPSAVGNEPLVPSVPEDGAWRERSRPIANNRYPAGDVCSRCGLCDTYYVAKVREACAFLGDGMSRVDALEASTHGRRRDLDDEDELYFGVHSDVVFAKLTPGVEGAQWTGIVTTIAVEMLRAGKVEAVVCVQSDPNDVLKPRPVLATTVEEVVAARGVKPSLSPNLEVLAEVEARGIKRLLFIGVGCQVQALRSVEKHLGLDALYVVGTNCVDNGPREGLDKFLRLSSKTPERVRHYEFMQVSRTTRTRTHFAFLPSSLLHLFSGL